MRSDLRPTRPTTYEFVTALEAARQRRDVGPGEDAQEHLDAIAGKDRREHWVIERGGKPEGFLIAYDCSTAGAGVYVKRVLVDRKEQGTGTAALRSYLDIVFARPGVDRVWLIVRNHNARAQAVYEKLGFVRVDDASEEARRYDAVAEAPPEKCFRMRKLGPAAVQSARR